MVKRSKRPLPIARLPDVSHRVGPLLPRGDEQARDVRDVGDALKKADSEGALNYTHKTYREDAALWFADAVAWAAGAGGDWLRRVDCVFHR